MNKQSPKLRCLIILLLAQMLVKHFILIGWQQLCGELLLSWDTDLVRFYLAMRREGSDAVGGGGGPRFSRSSR